MSTLFKHIIITRFNIKAANHTNIDKNNSPVLTIEWMKKRIKLFRNYCLPSMLNQTCKNFIWLIFFDIDTRDEFKQEISLLLKEFPFICPKYVNDKQHLYDTLYTNISSFLDHDTRYLITTRLDNDDAFHKDAIAKIQQAFASFDMNRKANNHKKLLINLYSGWCLKVEPHFELTTYSHPSNPFISMVEKIDVEEFETILTAKHDEFLSQDGYEFIQIQDGSYWLQVIHSSNLLNDIVGWPSLNSKHLTDFGINPSRIDLKRRDYAKNLARRLWHSVENKLKQF